MQPDGGLLEKKGVIEMKRFLRVALALAFGSLGAAAVARAQGALHAESTTVSNATGQKTGTKTETVVGAVKEYEAGKKIVVTGPGKKDYSFDLEENAGVMGDIAVGETVKVTDSKTDGGPRVTIVAPYAVGKRQAKKKLESTGP